MTDVGLIDPTRFAGADVDPDVVRSAAAGLAQGAVEVRRGGADVVAQWRRLGQHYEAPEAYRLLHAMDPVERDSGRFADDLEAVVGALHRYADDVAPALDLRRMVTIEAEWFLGVIAGDPDWRRDQRLVDQHMGLLRSANEVQVLLWDAERRCANAIRALCGAASWRPSTGAADSRGYGWTSIPDTVEMPWGAPVQRQDVCAKAAFVQVKRFVWDGVVWDGLMGALKGLGSLVGIGDEADGSWGWSHSWSAARETWRGMTALAGHEDGAWSTGTAREAWLGMGKGLLSWDSWADDPGRASGGAVFNVVSLAVPFVGVAKGLSVLGGAGRAGAGVRSVTAVLDPAEIADDVAADAARRASLPAQDLLDIEVETAWGTMERLPSHVMSHGADFGTKSAEVYVRLASEFLQSGLRGGTPVKIDADGVIRMYEPSSNTFAAYNADGTIRTFFKPSAGMKYWDRQPGSNPWE